jgi:UDP-N-acetylglucosamine--N-acetylmuramyl-(pentapeptide) pyrophosphoryl-undecaprenol N-acetylglucosamine transferase
MSDLILFAGGGTGGHLFPGIAVVEALRRRRPGTRVLFVGSDRDVEQRILAEHDLPHVPLPQAPVRDLRRRPARFLWRNWRALVQARGIIRDQRPCAVIGLGGWASAATIWEARRAQIPILLLEQNAIPGRATRWLAHFARVICVAFPECLDHLPPDLPALVCGNPVRTDIARLCDRPCVGAGAKEQKSLLVLGGSQGAEALNNAVIELVRRHRAALAGWTIIHQTGPNQMEQVQSAYTAWGQPHLVADFFPRLLDQYRQAELVISRAGATTLAELACVGKPMVLVPYPQATNDHQRANAEAMLRHGAAAMAVQAETAEATAEALWSAIAPWLNDAALRQRIGHAARALAHPEAADRVVGLLDDALRSAA